MEIIIFLSLCHKDVLQSLSEKTTHSIRESSRSPNSLGNLHILHFCKTRNHIDVRNQCNHDLNMYGAALTRRQATLRPDVDLHLEVQVAVISLHFLLLHQRQHLGFLLL